MKFQRRRFTSSRNVYTRLISSHEFSPRVEVTNNKIFSPTAILLMPIGWFLYQWNFGKNMIFFEKMWKALKYQPKLERSFCLWCWDPIERTILLSKCLRFYRRPEKCIKSNLWAVKQGILVYCINVYGKKSPAPSKILFSVFSMNKCCLKESVFSANKCCLNESSYLNEFSIKMFYNPFLW